jgi:outer membrane protein assembly factor BamB
MVCLQGDAADREAVVVGAGGVVSEPRALDAADERRYGKARPGPEGTVLRAQRVGPESMVDVGDARCTEDTGECNGTVEAGRDLVLRAEDATTGEERWTATVPFRATDAQDCTPWYGPPWNGWEDATADEPLAPEAFGAQTGADLIDVWGCGVASAVTSDGALLRAEGTAGSGMTVSLGGGRYATVTPPGPGQAMSRTTLFASGGSVVGEIREYANPPRTTDEPDRTTLFASGSSGGRLRSYAADGSLRWDVAASVASGAPELLAQVDGTLVTSSWTSGFQGLDLATGAERWSWEPRAALGVGYDVGYVSQVFTDGRSVLLPLQSELGAVELVVLDATSGELGWNRSLADVIGPEQNAYLVAVDGHLLVITPEGVRGLG